MFYHSLCVFTDRKKEDFFLLRNEYQWKASYTSNTGPDWSNLLYVLLKHVIKRGDVNKKIICFSFEDVMEVWIQTLGRYLRPVSLPSIRFVLSNALGKWANPLEMKLNLYFLFQLICLILTVLQVYLTHLLPHFESIWTTVYIFFQWATHPKPWPSMDVLLI